MDAPAAKEPDTDSPLTIIARPSPTASAMFATRATITAAASGAYRPTTVAPTISARPSSSF